MSIAYGPKKVINGAAAGSAHTSSDSGNTATLKRSCDLNLYTALSLQLIWSGLTGTLNGTLTLECSGNDSNWDTKKNSAGTDVVITVSGAAGNDTIAIDNAFERYFRVVWAPVGVTGGLITVLLHAKD